MPLLGGMLVTSAPVFVELRFPNEIESSVHSNCSQDIQIIPDKETGSGFLILLPATEITEVTFKKKKTHQQKLLEPFSLLPAHIDRNYLDFPFFSDPATFRYINSKGSKVLFILRGVSGSGKSTIVHLIKASFDPEKLAVCSADDYFCGSDGTYQFDEKLLGAAHSECQQKAKQACRANTPIVVIDNTNVRRWEMKFYLNLGTTFGYVTILVKPKTPWSMDPQRLASRTTHKVPLETLQRKVKSFDDVIPCYYGWFCSEDKSASLLNLSRHILTECFRTFPNFRQDLLSILRIKTSTLDLDTACGILDKYYTRPRQAGATLHCTAKFCGRGKVPGSSSYHQRPEVQASYGRAFQISIPGLVFTRQTMAARVTLGGDALTLFSKPEEEEWDLSGKSTASSPAGTDSKGRNKSSKKAQAKAEKRLKRKVRRSGEWEEEEEEKDDFEERVESFGHEAVSKNKSGSRFTMRRTQSDAPGEGASVSEMCEDLESKLVIRGNSLSDLFPGVVFQGFARSAHLTLQTAQGVESKEVTIDLLQTCDIEQEIDRTGRAPRLVRVPHGQACYYGNGLCCVYFDKPLKLKTIFSGHN
ncbi:2',3'-cyclic-nucleotide 3'-phosphodiesterase [Plakobranchus ocellatus]|uniref:2',3'-cyclic-nucleotide 3'-phosphodiesterase n=1 Tax=Plakobranchus ocellatus TaxID=259542 RepID=A0AAV4AGB5_9GAST|nr:2',3'-cyclic-nucleotide 3'-phosphodiesterase [Plakobranchus ocellatus]